LLAFVSCSSTGGDSVRVKKYKLDHTARITAVDPAIRFEQRHRLHGAVSAADMEARDGLYLTTRWTLADGSQPAKLVLEYRQAKTGSKILKKEADVSGGGGSHEFTIVGDEQKDNGVTGWRVTLRRGGQTLATYASYMWE
jgi:hypothetical protein